MGEGGKLHNFTVEGEGTVKDGTVVLKVTNTAPVITNKGADGNGDETKKVFDVSQEKDIQVFIVADADNGDIPTTHPSRV